MKKLKKTSAFLKVPNDKINDKHMKINDKHMKHKLLLLSSIGFSAGIISAQKPMNVIYILADDLGYGDLSCLGQTKFSTPSIDKLAKEGMLFTQHYSGSTVSAPSRSCLMTGQHTGHTYIRGNKGFTDGKEGQEPLTLETYILPEMFKEAGYVSGCFGKWGLGYPGSTGDPMNQGFDTFYGYNCQSESHHYYPDHLWKNRKKVMLSENAKFNLVQYAPDLIHNEALQFITDNQSRPFFAYLSYVAPHAELIAPDDEILAKFKGKFKEKPYKAKEGDTYEDTFKAGAYCSQPEPYATFAAMVTRLDRQVGDIVAKLKELGLDKNTVIFFSSDNGPHREGGANPDFFKSYGPFRGVKRDLYEGGIRLPLIAWAPGKVKSGVNSNHICAMWDMMPTFAGIAGVKLHKNTKTDGISILPTLTGKGKQKQHKFLYWEFHERGGKIALRKGDWKLVIQQIMVNKDAEPELYNLVTDRHEDNNVANQHPEIVKEMLQLMKSSHVESTIFHFNNKSKYF